MASFPSQPLSSGPDNQTSSKPPLSSSSSSHRPTFGGKRLENYSSSAFFYNEDDDFAIADYSNESENEHAISDGDEEGPLGSDHQISQLYNSSSLNQDFKDPFKPLASPNTQSEFRKRRRSSVMARKLNISSNSDDSSSGPDDPLSPVNEGSDLEKEEGSEEFEDDYEDSDSSTDSGTVFLSQHPKASRLGKYQNVSLPRKLSIPAPKRLDLSSKNLHSGTSSQDEHGESIQGDSNDEKTIKSDQFSAFNDPVVKPRRPSIVDHTLDETSHFPRSTNMSLSALEESGESDDESPLSESYNDENLLALLSEEESSVADHSDESDFDEDDEADDDDAIEEREEQAILEEVKRSGDLEEPYKVGYESDEEEFDSDVSFGYDPFLEIDGTPSTAKNITSLPLQDALSDEEDESYLWSYFFTSGEEDSDEENEVDIDLEHEFVLPIELPQMESQIQAQIKSGDSTDEDETLPRPNSQARSRPTEILSTLSTTSRPPLLGSWVMSSERPYGIIDGLSTRTLKSDSPNDKRSDATFDGFESVDPHTPLKASSKTPVKQINGGFLDGNTDSEPDELALDDFIYTSELEVEDDAVDELRETPFDEPVFLSLNRDVPLSAFRNRASYSHFSFQQPRRLSHGGSRKRTREVLMTPVKSSGKRKRRKQGKKSDDNDKLEFLEGIDSHAKLSEQDLEAGTTDLIDELVGMGALSPLFGGIA